MGRLISVGCSLTEGQELEQDLGIKLYNYSKDNPVPQDILNKVADYRNNNSFTSVVAKNLMLTPINLGKGGSGNEKIVYSAVNYIEDNPGVKFVLVNTSGITRVSTSKGDFNVLNEFEDSLFWDLPDRFSQPKEFKSFYKLFRELYLSPWRLVEFQMHLVRYIVSYLENKNIPYLIAPAIGSDLDYSSITKYTISTNFNEFAKKGKFEQAIQNHWLTDAHKAWGEYLTERIQVLYPWLFSKKTYLVDGNTVI